MLYVASGGDGVIGGMEGSPVMLIFSKSSRICSSRHVYFQTPTIIDIHGWFIVK